MVSAGLRSLFLLSLTAVAACSYTRHEGVLSNGERSQLYFSVPTRGSDPIATGYALKVTVERHSAGDVSCHGLGVKDDRGATGAGAVRIQGGSIDTEHCGSLPSDAVTFVSASCADDTCVATEVANDPHLVTLAVTGAHAGTTHLIVSLKSNDDGHTYEDTIALRFAVPARIELSADPREVAAMNGPVLPGVAITKPSASVVDADGEVLEVADDAPTATAEGSAFVETTNYPPFEAQASGHTVLRWTYPGVPDRTLDLEVADPSEARALFVYAPLDPAHTSGFASGAGIDPADAPPAAEPATGRITSIELVAYDFGTYPMRVRLADGRFAVCAIADPVVTPSALATTTSGLDLSSFDLEGKVAGQGTVTLRAAPSGTAATATLPVKINPRPPR